MKIRRAKPKDAREIGNLRKTTFKNINNRGNTNEDVKNFNKNNTNKIILKKIDKRDMFCLTNNNEILGTIDLDENKIGGLFIRCSHINKGLGTKLLKFIENYAKKKGIKKVKLYSTKHAYDFYIKNNYKLVKKRFWKVGNSKVLNYEMEKKL